MGANTTLRVSREVALAKLAEKLLNHPSDAKIEEMLNEHLKDGLYDVSVDERFNGPDDDMLRMKSI